MCVFFLLSIRCHGDLHQLLKVYYHHNNCSVHEKYEQLLPCDSHAQSEDIYACVICIRYTNLKNDTEIHIPCVAFRVIVLLDGTTAGSDV